MIKKQVVPIRFINGILVFFIGLTFFTTRSCSKYYDLLSGKKTIIGIANTYEHHHHKGTTSYYVYKANGHYYFGKVQSHHASPSINSDILIESFYVAYREDNPQIHVLLYQKKVDITFNLDTIIPRNEQINKLIRRNTFDHGAGDDADVSDWEELYKYKQKVKRWKRL